MRPCFFRTAMRAGLDTDILLKAYELMCTSKRMAELYDENREACRYVHSTSRGHEAIQLAAGLQLTPADYVSPYYRDESMLLGIGLEPYELMLQLIARRDDPFSGGRSYYGHPSLRRQGFPTIPHQSAATGMQAIPATGWRPTAAKAAAARAGRRRERVIGGGRWREGS